MKKMMFSRLVFLCLSLVLSVSGMAQKKTVILLSKIYGKGEYQSWLTRQNPDLKLVSYYHCPKDSMAYWLANADGFLITGGEDIYPSRYGKEKDTVDCGDFDKMRDTLEFKMLDAAFQRKKPVFGICRGLQMINVYQGGTLVVDIPSALGEKVNHRKDGPIQHPVTVIPKTSLAVLSGIKDGPVLSNHHQGIEKMGTGLKAMAKSEDGLVEAIEQAGSRLPFLMAVQWHPERMDEKSPLSASLAKAFVKACVGLK
jgi:putative glutamine amidotransferase